MNEINNPLKTPAILSEINYCGHIIRKFSHDDGFEAYYAEDIAKISGIETVRNSVKSYTYVEIVGKDDRNRYGITTYRRYKNERRKDDRIILLTKQGLVRLLSKCRSPKSAELAKFFDINIYEHKFAPVETTTIKIIQDVFAGEKMITQRLSGNYRIDLYFPDYNLAIECDEHNHNDRNQEYENKREAFIKEELGCEFIRYNPNANNFNINNVLNQIFKHTRNHPE
jgi:very-short-patch-repair endonuclease